MKFERSHNCEKYDFLITLCPNTRLDHRGYHHPFMSWKLNVIFKDVFRRAMSTYFFCVYFNSAFDL